jgi:hypothetical protein
MTQVSCNCIVCAQEFDPGELQNVALSAINVTNFKVCQACFDTSDPAEDYNDVRRVVTYYLKLAQARHLFDECNDILNSRNGE